MKRKIYDITYTIENDMPRFDAPWHPDVDITQIGYIDQVGRETRKITFGSHTGTHMDAPLHFVSNGNSIDQIPLDICIGPVTILDFTHFKKNQELTVEDIKNYELSSRIILNFGWSQYWKTNQFYSSYPFFSEETAQFLLSFGVKLIGMDTPSPDASMITREINNLDNYEDSPIHKLFLKNNVLLLEYLNLKTIPSNFSNCNLIALPLKLKGSDDSPVRACVYNDEELK